MIAFDATALGEETGGYPRYVEELLRELTPAPDLTVLHRSCWSLPAGAPALVSPFRNRVLTEQLWLPRVARRFDLLHVPAYAGPWPGLGSTRLVLTVHDATAARREPGRGAFAQWYWRTVLPRNLRRAARVVTDSQAAAAAIVGTYGTPPDKLRVVTPGVHRLPEGKLPAGCPAPPFILMVGLAPERKRANLLLAAHRQMITRIPLVLAGRGAESFAACAGPEVHFTGEATDAELGALYRAASFLVYPSAEEGFGFPPLEAFLGGCAVLAAPSAAVRETAGDAPRYVERAEPAAWAAAMDSFLRDDAERAMRVAAGAAQAAQFSWARAARELRAVYQEVIGE